MTFNKGSKQGRTITSFSGTSSRRSKTEIEAERHRNAARKLAQTDPKKRR